MSCIVAVKTENEIVVGADNLMSGWNSKFHVDGCKLFENDGIIYGFAGGLRLLNLLKHTFEPPLFKRGQSTEDYIHNDYVPAFRELLKINGMLTNEGQVVEGIRFSIIIVIEGSIYELFTDFSIFENGLEYIASGSGQEYAYGSLYSTKTQKAEDRVKMAIEATSFFCPSVGIDSSVEILRQKINND